MTPSVGRIVHYVSHGTPPRADGSQAYASQCRAAVITEVDDMEPVPAHGVPSVGLCVLNPTGQFFNQGVPFGDARGVLYEGDAGSGPQPARRAGGTWHWPERVD